VLMRIGCTFLRRYLWQNAGKLGFLQSSVPAPIQMSQFG